MIQIDDELMEAREFSGRVVVSFNRGELQDIQIVEIASSKDPRMKEKLLIHGIHHKQFIKIVKEKEEEGTIEIVS